MAGSTVASSGVGSTRSLLRDREAFGVFVLSTSAMETCWPTRAAVPGILCLSASPRGSVFALMLNQLLLGVGGKTDSNYAGLVPPGGAHSPSLFFFFSLCTLQFALQSSYAVVKLFFPVLVET